MNVRELIEIINIFNANVIFDNPKDSVELVLAAGHSPLYFLAIEGKEKNKYDHSSNKSEFVSSTASIHIIDLDIQDLINIFECDGTGIYQLTKDMISPFYSSNIPEDIVFISFLFLHEIGHWNQFIRMGKNVEQYKNKDLDLEKENNEKVVQLRKQQLERINKGNLCVLTSNEKKLFKQYMLEYRQIPKEKDADQFALEHMNLILEKYKNHNKYE